MPRPIILILIPYLLGLIAGYYLNVPLHIPILLLFISASLASASILIRKRPLIFFAFSMLTLFILGFARMNALLNPFLPENHISNIASDEPLSLEGKISSSPSPGLDKTRLSIELSTLYAGDIPYPVTGKLLLTMGEKETDLRYGETIRFLARVKRPRNFHNPGGFDYEKYLALKGIFATSFLKDAEGIVRIAEGRRSFNGWIEDVRESIRDNVQKNAGASSPLLLALITGDQGEIPKETRDAFSRAGTAHILAISGEHVGLIIMLSFAILIWMFRRSERAMLAINIYKVAAVITIPVIIIYSLIAGGGFSIVRSAIMGGTVLTALLIDRRRDMPTLMAFAAFLILLFEPQALFDISFQLSFASVISLMVIFPYLNRIYERNDGSNPETTVRTASSRIWSHVAMLATVSVAATIGTTPIVAYYFNRISIISPIANLVTVPIIGFIIVPLGLMSSLLIPLSQTLSGLLVSVNSWLISWIVSLTNLFASIPMASVRVVTPNLFEITLFYVIVALVVYRKKFEWAKRLLIPALALMVASESFYYFKPWLQKDLKVTFLDVGQAESTLIEFPGGKRMLIDGGGSPNTDFDVGEKVVAPFLWHERITRLDYIVLSHPNSDHYGGLSFIVRNFDVGEVWESGIEDENAGYADFKRALMERLLLSKKVGDGDKLIINKATIKVLNPPKGYSPTDDSSANNGSLVLKITHGNTSFLFTGDIEKAAEEQLLCKGSELKSTVLKVPHHGSLTSSTEGFLEKVQPQKAVFSVGDKNRFGFPKEAVTKRYKNIHAETYRTDRDGAIAAFSDGTKARLSKSLNSY